MKTELHRTATETKERAAFIGGLRDLANFLESTPEALTPYNHMFNVFADSKEHFAELARSIGGRWEKRNTSEYAALVRRFGPLTYEVNIEREKVCMRRVVETRIIPEMIIPEHTTEIVEWDCNEPILEVPRG